MAAAALPQELLVRIRGNSVEIEAAGRRATAALNGVQTAANRVAQRGAAAGAGLQRMQEPLRTISSQLTGINPAFLQLSTIVSSFALSSGMMVAALAGIAGLAVAWDRVTASSRAAKEAQQDAIGVLRGIQQKQREEGFGPAGATVIAVGETRKKALELQNDFLRMQGFFNASQDEMERAYLQGRINANRKAYAELKALIEAGEREIAEARMGAIATLPGITVTGRRAGPTPRRGAGRIGPSALERGIIAERNANRAAMAERRGLLPFGLSLSASTAAPNMGALRGGDDPAGGSLGVAADVWVNSMERVAQATIMGAGTIQESLVGMLQNVIGNIQTKGGGLFGATLPGMLLGAGLGIVGALFGRRSRSDPLPVRIQEVEPSAAKEMGGPPQTVIVRVVGSNGEVVKQTQYELGRRQARDAIQRLPPGVGLE